MSGRGLGGDFGPGRYAILHCLCAGGRVFRDPCCGLDKIETAAGRVLSPHALLGGAFFSAEPSRPPNDTTIAKAAVPPWTMLRGTIWTGRTPAERAITVRKRRMKAWFIHTNVYRSSARCCDIRSSIKARGRCCWIRYQARWMETGLEMDAPLRACWIAWTLYCCSSESPKLYEMFLPATMVMRGS